MKHQVNAKILIPSALVAMIAACAQLGGLLGTSDSQNRAILSDVAVSSTMSASQRGMVTDVKAATNGQCGENPLKEACSSDAQTYCADLLPPDPSQGSAGNQGETSFQERHQRMHAFINCLKSNLASLSAACQQVVQHMPVHPPGPGGNRSFNHGHGPGPRPPHPPGQCGGGSLLAACISDARSLCSTELPAPGEVAPFSPDERKQRVETLVNCLDSQLDSVSSECKTALDKLPRQSD